MLAYYNQVKDGRVNWKPSSRRPQASIGLSGRKREPHSVKESEPRGALGR